MGCRLAEGLGAKCYTLLLPSGGHGIGDGYGDRNGDGNGDGDGGGTGGDGDGGGDGDNDSGSYSHGDDSPTVLTGQYFPQCKFEQSSLPLLISMQASRYQ
jgi:hypothetical protein